MFRIFSCVLILIPCGLIAQNNNRDSQQKKDFEYAKNYRSSKRAQEISLQNRLERQIQWERIERERDNKRLKRTENKTIKKLEEMKSRANESDYYFIEENKMYTAPKEKAMYILNSGIKKGQQLVFYKNKKGDILKIAKVLSDNTIIIYYPEGTEDKKILIQQYIKVEPGSIFSLVSEV